MPTVISTMCDRAEIARSTLSKSDESLSALFTAPATVWAAIGRGIRGRCPRCGEAKLFRRFLKPTLCEHCLAEWTGAQADDFPAYISILVSGHILAPIIIALGSDPRLSTSQVIAIALPVAILLTVGLLQPAKGAVIALQWWFAMSSVEGAPISGSDTRQEGSISPAADQPVAEAPVVSAKLQHAGPQPQSGSEPVLSVPE